MARATLIGFSAVAMWALLALLTDASGAVPPFLLSAITFAIGTCVGLAARLVSRPGERGEKGDRGEGMAFETFHGSRPQSASNRRSASSAPSGMA